MITRRALGLTGVAALGLSACGRGENDGVSGPGEVSFSVLSGASRWGRRFSFLMSRGFSTSLALIPVGTSL